MNTLDNKIPTHFEDLWQISESLFKGQEDNVETIIVEISAKFAIYKSLDQSANLNREEVKKIKTSIYGKILSSLTQLSLIDDINSFAALYQACNDIKSENTLSEK